MDTDTRARKTGEYRKLRESVLGITDRAMAEKRELTDTEQAELKSNGRAGEGDVRRARAGSAWQAHHRLRHLQGRHGALAQARSVRPP